MNMYGFYHPCTMSYPYNLPPFDYSMTNPFTSDGTVRVTVINNESYPVRVSIKLYTIDTNQLLDNIYFSVPAAQSSTDTFNLPRGITASQVYQQFSINDDYGRLVCSATSLRKQQVTISIINRRCTEL